jgi:hypothetical protein
MALGLCAKLHHHVTTAHLGSPCKGFLDRLCPRSRESGESLEIEWAFEWLWMALIGRGAHSKVATIDTGLRANL